MLAHHAARLNSFAFHDPKNIPEFRASEAAGPAAEVPNAADDARVRAFFIAMAERSA